MDNEPEETIQRLQQELKLQKDLNQWLLQQVVERIMKAEKLGYRESCPVKLQAYSECLDDLVTITNNIQNENIVPTYQDGKFTFLSKSGWC